MRYRISAPEKDYTGKIGTVGFIDGVAYVEVEDDNDPEHLHAPALRYFRAQGYTVEEFDGVPVGQLDLAAENAELRAELEQLRATQAPAPKRATNAKETSQ